MRPPVSAALGRAERRAAFKPAHASRETRLARRPSFPARDRPTHPSDAGLV